MLSFILLPGAAEELKQSMYFCFPLKYEGKKNWQFCSPKKQVMKDVLKYHKITGKSISPLMILRSTEKRFLENYMPKHSIK